jgi:hypothetical protein
MGWWALYDEAGGWQCNAARSPAFKMQFSAKFSQNAEPQPRLHQKIQ